MAERNQEMAREETLKKIEQHMDEIVKLAQECGLSGEEVLAMMKFSLEE